MVKAGNSVLERYVTLHNVGVRTRDFLPLSGIFHPAAEMRFEGVALGPYVGRAAVLGAFQDHGPDDEIEILERKGQEPHCHATYAWVSRPGLAAGRLVIEVDAGLIRRLTISIESP
jgi:hypothetical protein